MKSPNLSLRRIFMLVMMSILLFAMVTLGVYSMISPHFFAQAKFNELYPRAQFLAEQAGVYFANNGDNEGQEAMRYFRVDSRQWGATVYLLDKDRNVIANTDNSTAHSTVSVSVANFESLIHQVLAGEELTYLSYVLDNPELMAGANDLLFIGVPVTVNGAVEGAVILIKPLNEIISAMSSLSSTLWFSALAVLAVMLPLIYWFSSRITLPLGQMRDVALRMSAGDFSVRANDLERGEMGDMARALNHLSSELGETIIELTRERNQAVTIVNALGEGVLAVNTEGMPMMGNPALQTMMIAAGRDNYMPQEVWAEFHTALSENRCTDNTFLLGDMLIHLTVTPVSNGENKAISAIGVFHDETQAHRLEQTRREYVANVSHELRTPLTALRALIEPLRDGLIRTEEKRQETYNIILRETMRLSRLVDDMLELSRLQSGRLALEKIRFRIEPLLRETASTYAAKAADTGHQLVLDIPEDPPLQSVLGNPDRTEQVLIALMNNALTYTPAGSQIYMRVRPMDAYLHVIVEDNGPGIRPEDLPHIFGRFYKADKSHGGSSGTGLGLAIAQELMERLGETIFVENRAEGGARFTFTLHYE